MRQFILLLAAAAALGLCPQVAWAEVSLATEDRLDSIPVKVRGQATVFTCVRDAWNARQWYVVPDRPRLATRLNSHGQEIPELSLMLIQTVNARNQTVTDEAVLQFAVSLNIPAEAVDQLKQEIAKRYSGPEKLDAATITVAPLPLSSADVQLFVPSTGQFLQAEPMGTGVAGTFASSEQIFTLHLTKKGADALATQLTDGNGIGVQYTLKYLGQTPKAGFKVKVNYTQLAHHLSTNEKWKARSGLWFDFFSATATHDRQEVLNELEGSKCLEVEIIEGSNLKKEDIFKQLDPILARIQKELEFTFAPPPPVPAAQVADPEAFGRGLGVGYSRVVKDVTTKKRGEEVISFAARSLVEKTHIVGGFASLRPFPKAVRDECVILVKPGPWASSYFLLPAIGADLGVRSATVTVALMKGDEELVTDTATWEPANGVGHWTNTRGRAIRHLVFGLIASGLRGKADLKDKNVHYAVSLTLTTADQDATVRRKVPVFDGSLPLPNLSRGLFDVVTINPAALSFRQVDPKDPDATATAVHVALQAGSASLRKAITPYVENGRTVPPRPLVFLVPKAEGGDVPIAAKVVLQRAGGAKSPLIETKDLAKDEPSLSVILDVPSAGPAQAPAAGEAGPSVPAGQKTAPGGK